MSEKRICGLITDFGNRDYFIGVLKGVMKQINPHLDVIDIANEILSYNVLPASFALDKSRGFFPAGTIFLVVVDPGVGTARKILLVEFDNQYFIGPDNGVLTPILEESEAKVREVVNTRYYLIPEGTVSTFEARDKMAPVAAYLSAGISPDEIGTPCTDFIINRDYFPVRSKGSIEASIAYIDKFGNLMTNVSADLLFSALEEVDAAGIKIELKGNEIHRFYKTYGEAGEDNNPFMLIGSHQNLEIALNQNSAASALQAGIGDPLKIVFR